MGFLIGAIIAIMLLTALWRLLFKRFMSDYRLAFVSVFAAVVTSVVLYGFGGADGGEPEFASGVGPYGLAGLIVFGLLCIGVKRSRKDGNG
ncbi:MAG TPA: hypothetical protein VJM81_06590 [Rhizorhapis sp.]|nr:hypothetical protein [Rhizorhapis sp.]